MGGDTEAQMIGQGLQRCVEAAFEWRADDARDEKRLLDDSERLRSFLEGAVGDQEVVFIDVFMTWGLWKSLASALFYIDVSVRPSSEALFFFGHLLTRFNLPQAPLVRQGVVSLFTVSQVPLIYH